MRISGTKNGKEFSTVIKKVRRWRKRWEVSVEEGEEIELRSIPPLEEEEFVINEITSLDGKLISEPERVKVVEEEAEEEEEDEYEEEEEGVRKEKPTEVNVDTLDYWFSDKLGPKCSHEQGFWKRQGITPTLPECDAEEWILQLRGAEKKKEEDLTKMVKRGLALTTRQNHRRILNWLEEMEPPKERSVTNWLLDVFETAEKEKAWKGSTLATMMSSAQGALANLAVYRRNIPPMILKASAEWRMGVKGAGVAARLQIPQQAKIANGKMIEEAIKKEKTIERKVALELMWVSAARGGDIIKLLAREVECTERSTKIRFLVGKTASSQPYTVSTAALSKRAQEYIKRKKEEEGVEWLFPGVSVTELSAALKKVDVGLEVRSVRRGALQHLASQGMSDTELMNYSQHRCISTLRRYLDFGWESGETEERAERARTLGVK